MNIEEIENYPNDFGPEQDQFRYLKRTNNNVLW